jgi:hypothetical protein
MTTAAPLPPNPAASLRAARLSAGFKTVTAMFQADPGLADHLARCLAASSTAVRCGSRLETASAWFWGMVARHGREDAMQMIWEVLESSSPDHPPIAAVLDDRFWRAVGGTLH